MILTTLTTLAIIGISSLTGGGLGALITKLLGKKPASIFTDVPIVTLDTTDIPLTVPQFYELSYICTKHLNSAEPHYVVSVNNTTIKLRSTIFKVQ